jgi:ubiquinone/menaquinone biosynthesis C-methylase UbiE
MAERNPQLKLLPAGSILKTSRVDHADWNFRPLLGLIQRQRFKLILSLLSNCHCHRLLEVGYGSGVFMPELVQHCDDLYGIDIHDKNGPVNDILKSFDITAKLYNGSVESMPFSPNFFDGIVAVSTLDMVIDLDAACVEMQRVLRKGGFLTLVTPTSSPIADFGVKILTGENPKRDYSNRRQALLPTLLKYFTIQQRLTFPPLDSSVIRLYTALKLYPRM